MPALRTCSITLSMFIMLPKITRFSSNVFRRTVPLDARDDRPSLGLARDARAGAGLLSTGSGVESEAALPADTADRERE